jgi:hypothetical protein
MNALETSSAFATVVSLICTFVQTRTATKAASREQFIEWLEYHRHEDLKDAISESAALQGALDGLLRQNHAELLQEIKSTADIIASVASRLKPFAPLAGESQNPLSEQAMLFLHHLVDVGQDQLVLIGSLGTPCFGSGDPAGFYEERFIRDDLKQLTQLGFLDEERTGSDNLIYRLTRSGLRFYKASAWKPGPEDE